MASISRESWAISGRRVSGTWAARVIASVIRPSSCCESCASSGRSRSETWPVRASASSIRLSTSRESWTSSGRSLSPTCPARSRASATRAFSSSESWPSSGRSLSPTCPARSKVPLIRESSSSERRAISGRSLSPTSLARSSASLIRRSSCSESWAISGRSLSPAWAARATASSIALSRRSDRRASSGSIASPARATRSATLSTRPVSSSICGCRVSPAVDITFSAYFTTSAMRRVSASVASDRRLPISCEVSISFSITSSPTRARDSPSSRKVSVIERARAAAAPRVASVRSAWTSRSPVIDLVISCERSAARIRVWACSSRTSRTSRAWSAVRSVTSWRTVICSAIWSLRD